MITKEGDIQFFLDAADRDGGACATVSDGHIVIFRTDFLKDLLEQHADKDKLVIFLKRPTFDN